MWTEKNYAERFDLSWEHVNDTLERVDVKEVGCKEFIERFEAPYKPCVITGAQDHWGAKQKWTLEVA